MLGHTWFLSSGYWPHVNELNLVRTALGGRVNKQIYSTWVYGEYIEHTCFAPKYT